MRRLRLVKVIVQPVFVLDDGEDIVEINHQPTVIPASEWPTYSSVRFPRELKEWQAHLDDEDRARTHSQGPMRHQPTADEQISQGA